MVGVVGGNALAGPTGAELAQQGARNFGQGAQALAQLMEERSQRKQKFAIEQAQLKQKTEIEQARLMEERFQQDQKIATEQITEMAEGIPGGLPVFLKTKEGKEAVMAFAPKLFRGLDAEKKAEQWLAAYDAAPMSTEQLRQADEYFKVTGMMTPETEVQPGTAPDFRSFLPASQQGASEPTPAQAPTQPVATPVKPPQAVGSTPEVDLNEVFERTQSTFVQMKPVSVRSDGSVEVRNQLDPTTALRFVDGTDPSTTQKFVVTDPLTGKPGQYPDGSIMAFDTVDRANEAYKGLLFKMNEQREGYGGRYKTIVDSIFAPAPTESDIIRSREAAAFKQRQERERGATSTTVSSQATSGSTVLRPDMTPREFLLAKKAAGFNLDVNPQGSTPDAELLASVSSDTRREYEANRRGIAPAWANRKPKETAAVSTSPQSASPSVINPAVEGEALTRARQMGITDDEIAALQALNTATDPSQLDDKTQILYSRALSKIATASRKEIKRYKFTPEARARLSEANAAMLETVSRNMDADSPLRDDPRMSHIFENPAQINIDAAKSEIALKNAQATKALVDAGYAGEELALKKRQIEAMEVAAAAEVLAARSPQYKELVAATDKIIARYEDRYAEAFKKAKNAEEVEKLRKQMHSDLMQEPGYSGLSKSLTTLLGNWGDLGVTPVDIAVVKRGLWGGLENAGEPVSGLALDPLYEGGNMSGSAYNADNPALSASVKARYGQ